MDELQAVLEAGQRQMQGEESGPSTLAVPPALTLPPAYPAPPPGYPAPAYPYPPPVYYPPPPYNPAPASYPAAGTPPQPSGGYAPSGSAGSPSITYTPRRGWTNAQGEYCREYRTTGPAGNRTTERYGTACRDASGQWRIVN